jgi:hypothetical protein
MNSADQTNNASKRDATLRSEIARRLAESLIQSEGLLSLSQELDRKAIPNELLPQMEEDDARKALLQLFEANPNLLPSDSLGQAMSLPPDERGSWALEQLMSNLSNEDSS